MKRVWYLHLGAGNVALKEDCPARGIGPDPIEHIHGPELLLPFVRQSRWQSMLEPWTRGSGIFGLDGLWCGTNRMYTCMGRGRMVSLGWTRESDQL